MLWGRVRSGAEYERQQALQILGLRSGVPWAKVAARYRRLALDWHPDRNRSPQAYERFRLISSAYKCLDTLRRRESLSSSVELERLYGDPKVRGLSVQEISMRLLYSSSPYVRAAAACLLGSTVGSPVARKALTSARVDSDAMVRSVACESLGRVGRLGDLLAFLPWVEWGFWGTYLRALGRCLGKSLRIRPPGAETGDGRGAATKGPAPDQSRDHSA